MFSYEKSQNRSILEVQARGEEVMAALSPFHVAGAVNEEALTSFNQALGLPIPHLIIFENMRSPELRTLVERHLGSVAGKFAGRYYMQANVAVVDQSKNPTKAQLESVVTHEFAHSAIPVGYWTRRAIARSAFPVEGFMNRRGGGSILEEGFATLVDGSRRQIVDRVQRDTDSLELPAKYESGPGLAYAHAAIALECLGASNPGLIEPMFNFRQHPKEAKKVQEEVDRISPGLFSYLMSIPYGATNGKYHFVRGCRNVLDLVGMQRKDIFEIADSGPVATYVRDKITASPKIIEC